MAFLSISGLGAEELVTITDFEAAARRFLNGNDRVASRRSAANDEVNVGASKNIVHAGIGNDEVSAIGAALGSSRFYGEAGNDRLYGWSGKDLLSDGDGRDTLYGWAGTDTLTGGRRPAAGRRRRGQARRRQGC